MISNCTAVILGCSLLLCCCIYFAIYEYMFRYFFIYP